MLIKHPLIEELFHTIQYWQITKIHSSCFQMANWLMHNPLYE